MKISEFMQGITPNPAYVAVVADTASHYLLGIAFTTQEESDPKNYTAAVEGITEHPASLESETKETTYLHTAKSTVKTGTQRKFTVSGDRMSGDAFQDALLAFALKFGVGSTVVRPYIYFNTLTGKGEKGKVSIDIKDDTGGSAGDNATFSAEMTSVGRVEEYTYTGA